MDTIENRTAAIPDDEKTPIYFESWDEFKSCANGSGYDEKIKLAGGQNIFENATPSYPVVDPEAVFAADPAVIVKLIGGGSYTFGGYSGDGQDQAESLYDSLESRSGWSQIDAVKNDRLHILHNDIFGGPAHFIGIMYMAKWLYPGQFADMDPDGYFREYIEDYQGLDFGNYSDSVFVYPETG